MSNSHKKNETSTTAAHVTDGKYNGADFTADMAAFAQANEAHIVSGPMIDKTKSALEWAHAKVLLNDEQLEEHLDVLVRAKYQSLPTSEEKIEAEKAKDRLATIIHQVKFNNTMDILLNKSEQANHYHVGTAISTGTSLAKNNVVSREQMLAHFETMKTAALTPDLAKFRDSMIKTSSDALTLN